ncbi:MAG: DUF2796 domain-containing protein [Pseudomonadota bacterium]|nr:DUF2796 domain-containing protein [Pseudomonadota bacterium]
MKNYLRKFRAKITVFSLLLMASGAPPAYSENRAHDAHQHGVSRLNLVIEGTRLEMELESPGSDIIGFEHPPANKADRAAIANAVRLLKDSSKLFALSAAAECRLASAEVASPAEAQKKKHHVHGHGNQKNDHHDENARGEEHSDFYAHYRFACNHPNKLTHIEVKFFDVFPRAKEIDVRAVTPRNQFRRELTTGKSRLTL